MPMLGTAPCQTYLWPLRMASSGVPQGLPEGEYIGQEATHLDSLHPGEQQPAAVSRKTRRVSLSPGLQPSLGGDTFQSPHEGVHV